MIALEVRAELLRLEATGAVEQWFALLKECGAPVEVRVNDAGQWQARATGDLESWYAREVGV